MIYSQKIVLFCIAKGFATSRYIFATTSLHFFRVFYEVKSLIISVDTFRYRFKVVLGGLRFLKKLKPKKDKEIKALNIGC